MVAGRLRTGGRGLGAGRVMLLAMTGMLAAMQADPLAIVLPLAIPAGTSFIIEHRDVRRLPDGGEATFQERNHVAFTPVGDAYIVTMRSLGRSCAGPSDICAAFTRLGSGVDGRIFRFRLSLADHNVTLIDGRSAPPDGSGSEADSQMASVLAQTEAAAPGALLATDIRQLIRFAGSALPQPGAVMATSEGQIRLRELTATHATLAIQWEPRTAQALTLNGSGECRVNRASGLTEMCRYTDWLDQDRGSPVRVRTVDVVAQPTTVF